MHWSLRTGRMTSGRGGARTHRRRKLCTQALRLESTRHFEGPVGKPVWFFAKIDVITHPCQYPLYNVTGQIF